MGTIKFSLLILFLSFISFVKAQEIPSMDIKNMDGSIFSTDSIVNEGKPLIISFWATWCKPCVRELTSIADVYEDWQEETGVKLIAISTDDQRTFNSVMPFINGKDWPFDVYCDPNGDFKRAMSVNMIPHTFILDKDRKIVWQHTSFTEGGELELIDLVRRLNDGENISE